MPVYNPNESIEGIEIQGDSRDPIRFQRKTIINGIICFLFKATFNAHARIYSPLVNKLHMINPLALTTNGEKASGDAFIVASVDKKYSATLVNNLTGTHSGNVWKYRQQTNIKIITPRQEIINGIQKRLSSKISFSN